LAIKLLAPLKIKPPEEGEEVKVYGAPEATEIGVTIPEGWQIEVTGERYDLRTAAGTLVTQAQLEELIRSGVIDIPGDIYEREFVTTPEGLTIPKVGYAGELPGVREVPLPPFTLEISRLEQRLIEAPSFAEKEYIAGELAKLRQAQEVRVGVEAVFPEMELSEIAEYYFPEVEDITVAPPEERMRIEKEQKIATERFDEFLTGIMEVGRTPETESLLRSLFPAISEAEIASVFTPRLGDLLSYDEKITEIQSRYPEIVPVFDPVGMRLVIPEEIKTSEWYERMREEERQAYIDYGVSEAPIKNAWDAFILSGKQLLHKTAQFFTSTIPNFFFGEGGYGDIVGELAGFHTVFSKTEFAKEASNTFRRIYAQNEQKNIEWLRRHPELQPSPKYAEGSSEHPELWGDPGWYIYIIADNVSFSLAILGTSLGTFFLTRNPFLSIAAATAIATPSQSYDLYED